MMTYLTLKCWFIFRQKRDQPTDVPTDGRTDPVIEMRRRIYQWGRICLRTMKEEEVFIASAQIRYIGRDTKTPQKHESCL